MTVTDDKGPGDRSERPIEARYVRQGRRNTRMMWVMTTSLVLIALLFLAIWAAKLGPGANQLGKGGPAEARLTTQSPTPAKPAPAPGTPASRAE